MSLVRDAAFAVSAENCAIECPMSSVQPAIILVDRDPALRSALEFSFRLDGFGVNAFESGEALLASSIPTAGCCLVVDHDLPGMNGLQLIGQMRIRAAGLPTVLIGTQPTRAVRAAAAAAGVPIVEKPLMTDTLLTTVQKMLGDQASAQAEVGRRDLAGPDCASDGARHSTA